ncbi:MAG TPA: hypothetical protein DCQ94_21900 [Nitrospira sp.]|jgi:hypothetical protein|nr:hypothetical protein [Nitrospira sp.]
MTRTLLGMAVCAADIPASGAYVTFEPGEKRWYGASPDCAMTHIAIREMKDGKAAEWMEQVSNVDIKMPPRQLKKAMP